MVLLKPRLKSAAARRLLLQQTFHKSKDVGIKSFTRMLVSFSSAVLFSSFSLCASQIFCACVILGSTILK
jgi:hypothetical protein